MSVRVKSSKRDRAGNLIRVATHNAERVKALSVASAATVFQGIFCPPILSIRLAFVEPSDVVVILG